MCKLNKKIANAICFVLLIVFLASSLFGCQFSKVNFPKEQWALQNVGQEINRQKGKKGVDIGIAKVYKKILKHNGDYAPIGIVDNGVDFSHSSLSNSNYLSEDNGNVPSSHGTNIAGVICGQSKKNEFLGVLPNAKIISACIPKYNYESIGKIIDYFGYLESMGVRVVNCSFSMTVYSNRLYNKMKDSNMLFVCSAGNDGKNKVVYPAGFDLDNVIAVGGINNVGDVSKHSNYGEHIDVLAPGESVYTTELNNTFAFISGTSLARHLLQQQLRLFLC